MTGYYHAKRTALAKQYLDTREAQEHVTGRDFQLEVSRAWLDDYHRRPRVTRVNWGPRYPFKLTPPKEPTNAEGTETKIIEGEFTVVAHADASGGEAGSDGEESASGDQKAAHEPRRRPTRTGEFETPF